MVIIKADFHNHTVFSHGIGTIEENVKAAIKKGLNTIAISDHGPEHGLYGIKTADYIKMRVICDQMAEKYPEIKVMLGIEANILNVEGDLDVDERILKHADIVLAGYHFGLRTKRMIKDFDFHISNILSSRFKKYYNKALELNTAAMINAMEKYSITAITHPGAKGPFDVKAVAAVAAKKGVALEINNHHGHLSLTEILIAKEEGCNFLISSDAHKPGHVGVFDKALKRAEEAGLEDFRIINSSYYFV